MVSLPAVFSLLLSILSGFKYCAWIRPREAIHHPARLRGTTYPNYSELTFHKTDDTTGSMPHGQVHKTCRGDTAAEILFYGAGWNAVLLLVGQSSIPRWTPWVSTSVIKCHQLLVSFAVRFILCPVVPHSLACCFMWHIHGQRAFITAAREWCHTRWELSSFPANALSQGNTSHCAYVMLKLERRRNRWAINEQRWTICRIPLVLSSIAWQLFSIYDKTYQF